MSESDANNALIELTSREQDILRLLSDGMSDRQIADEFIFTVGTVKWYNRQIYIKLGVRNRTEAVMKAQALGLLESPLNNLSNVQQPPSLHNLPAQLTPFIGRKRELADIEGLLNVVRLVTITGSGGIGKTRLALEYARSQSPVFSSGIYFVWLAPIDDADNLIWAIAEALNFQFRRGSEPLQQLLNYLHPKKMLLILDNFEHLLDGAGVIPKLLQATESIRVIATSRERLNLYGEVTYAVGGLTLAENKVGGANTSSEAVDLFVERAIARLPSLQFSVDDLRQVERICRLVEGNPLGIELAATWVDTLLVAEIADEIEHNCDILRAEQRDTPQSQNSIRATFIRSWNLLDEAQQTAFRRLAVFRGGFFRQATAAITNVDLQTLRALVSKSLLYHDPVSGRYEQHELLRYFAQEQLEACGEANPIYAAHAAYFAIFMDENWERTKGHDQYEALCQIEADIENIRIAWNYSVSAGNVAQLKKYFHGLWMIYDVRGWYPAGLRLFAQAADVMRDIASPEAEVALGWLLAIQGMFIVASEYSSRRSYDLACDGVQILQKFGQNEDLVIPLMSLFITARQVGETAVSISAANECLAIATKTGNQWGIVKANQLLALRAIEEANYAVAARLGDEALSICVARGDRWSESVICIEVMATIAILEQAYEPAQAWLMRGLRAGEAIDFKYAIQMAYFQLGYKASLNKNYTQAATYWHKALAVAEHIMGGISIVGFFGTAATGDYEL